MGVKEFQKSFPVCSLTREDLIEAGFPKERIDEVDDGLMDEIAEKLGDALMDCYWTSLEVIVDEVTK